MSTNFKYASQSDLQNYFNKFGEYDQKIQIFPTLTSGNLHLFRDCGYVNTLFINGEEIASAQSSSGDVDTNGEWYYASSTNQLEYYNSGYSSTTVNEQVFEAGMDFATYIDQQLVNASLELHNYLDMRYSLPLEKSKQIDTDTVGISISAEYDPIIIKATCYIAASNLIRAKEGATDEGDYYYNLVTNPEGTGLIDKLNDGSYKLSSEIDNKDSKGSIRFRSINGTMDLVELYGDYSGERYDLLKVEIETSGVYGTSEYKVSYMSDDKLFGGTTSATIISGSLQHLYGGLWGRFQGNSATDGDYWEIQCYSDGVMPTNTKTNSIELHR